MFGIGHTLMEEMIYEDGQLLNGNLVDYRVPELRRSSRQVSTRFSSKMATVRVRSVLKVSVKAGLLPVASAIANAVSRAVGVRIQDLPLTPPKIWRALQAKAQSDAELEVSERVA